jgi:hypothetical protein
MISGRVMIAPQPEHGSRWPPDDHIDDGAVDRLLDKLFHIKLPHIKLPLVTLLLVPLHLIKLLPEQLLPVRCPLCAERRFGGAT